MINFLLVYDVTRKETFDSLSMWLQEVEQFSMGGGKDVVKLLVGNKVFYFINYHDFFTFINCLFFFERLINQEMFQEMMQVNGPNLEECYLWRLVRKLKKELHKFLMK